MRPHVKNSHRRPEQPIPNGSKARRPHRGRKRVVLLLSVGGLLALATVILRYTPTPRSMAAQTQKQPTIPPPDPPGTIDGSKNPELIPDEVAFRMLFLAVAEPESATEQQKARARAKIASAGLSDQDTAAFLTLLAEFHKKMSSVLAQNEEIRVRNPFPSPYGTDWPQGVQLRKQMEQNVADTLAALPARLSAEGMTKLRTHLENVKRGMKRIPLPNVDLMPKD